MLFGGSNAEGLNKSINASHYEDFLATNSTSFSRSLNRIPYQERGGKLKIVPDLFNQSLADTSYRSFGDSGSKYV